MALSQQMVLSPVDEGESLGSEGDLTHLVESDKKDKSSILETSMNFINSIIGSGIIGIPYAIKQAGFYFGLILLVFVALITDYSIRLLVTCGHLSGQRSYQEMVKATYGRAGHVTLTVLQCLYPILAMISYNIIVGDTVTKVFITIFDVGSGNVLANRYFIISMVTLFVTLPLCLFRSITKFSKLSLFAVVCWLFIFCVTIARHAEMSSAIPKSVSDFPFINVYATLAFGVMAHAFMCHHNTFLIYNSLQDNTLHRWRTVTHLSVGTSWVLTFAFGVLGYVTFRSYTEGDLFENYCSQDTLMSASRAVFALTVLLTYPIECFVVREVAEILLAHRYGPQDATGAVTGRVSRHAALTVAIVAVCALASFATDCLGIVLEINGVFVATLLAYIFPAMCFLKLEEGHILCRKKMPALALVFFGIFVLIFGTVVAVYKVAVKGITCSHGTEPPYCPGGALANGTTQLHF